MYGILLTDKNSNKLKLRVTANKFFKAKDIDRLFKGESLMKSIYKDSVQNLELSDFGCEDGFFIETEDLFMIELKKDKFLYSVQIEGLNDVKLDDIKEVLSVKFKNLENFDLQKKI